MIQSYIDKDWILVERQLGSNAVSQRNKFTPPLPPPLPLHHNLPPLQHLPQQQHLPHPQECQDLLPFCLDGLQTIWAALPLVSLTIRQTFPSRKPPAFLT